MLPLVWTLEEVAAALGRKPDAFRRRWRALHRQCGFPPPLPGLGLTWSRAAVEAWVRGVGQGQPANDDRAGVNVEALVAAQRAMLRQQLSGRDA